MPPRCQRGFGVTSVRKDNIRTITAMPSIALAVTADVPIFEAAIPCAVFGLARPDWVDLWYSFRVCAPADVPVGSWFRVDTPHGLADLATADTVIVPARHSTDLDPPDDLVAAVRAAHEAGARIASICTGAFVLAAAGLLDGRRVTTHWMHAERLAREYPAVTVEPDVLYIDDGDILSSAGTAAGIDLCLHIVRTDFGAAVANDLARRLVTAPHRPGGQAQYIPAPVPDQNSGIGPLFSWALDNLHRPLTVDDLARRMSMSARNLTRHFAAATGTTPLQWLLTQRIHRAQELLESTDASVEQIADRTGMGTATSLRRHFHRALGVSPDTYRRTFRAGTN
jgi:AraC family transcriptional regulator, transcriptional activator FtrA